MIVCVAMATDGNLLRERMAPLICATGKSPACSTLNQTKRPKHAVWLSPCETHGLGVSSYWTHSTINNTVLYAAFASWFTGEKDDTNRLWLGATIGKGCSRDRKSGSW